MVKRVLKKQNIPIFVASLWAAVYFINLLTAKNQTIIDAHVYIFVTACFWATTQTLHKAIKTHDNSILLYGALGFCCLALGRFYFLLLNFVSSLPDYVSIGNFCSVCCYLFYMSALMGLNKNHLQRNNAFYLTLALAANILSVIAAVTGVLAVILNSDTTFNATIILLDAVCVGASVSLLINKNKKAWFFAVMILITTVSDIVEGFNFITVISLLITAFTPAIYLLLGRSLIIIKDGD